MSQNELNTDLSDIIFKILVVGASGVGKTSLIRQFVDKKFVKDSRATIGVDFTLKNIQLEQLPKYKSISLQIWDLAGENQFHAIIPFYITGTHGIILSFDSTHKESFSSLNYWLDLINQHLEKPVPTVLISTKHDLAESNINHEAIKAFNKQFNIVEYFSTSAKSGLGIEETFNKLTELVVKSYELKEIVGAGEAI